MSRQFLTYFIFPISSILSNWMLIYGQSGYINEVPFQFLSIHNSPSYSNSALAGGNNSKEAGIAYSSRAGIFSSVRSVGFYCWSNLHNHKDSIRSFQHYLGIWAMAIQDGDIFSKNRLALYYSPSIPIGNYDWSTSIKAGIISYAFQSTDYSSGGADNKLSLEFSTALKHRNRYFAIGIHDFNNPELTPVLEKYMIPRYYSFLASNNINLRGRNSIRVGIQGYYFEKAKEFSIQPNLTYCWNEKLSIGIFFQSYTETGGVTLALEQIRIGNSNFKMIASYRSPSLKVAGLRFNFYELFLVYQFHSFKKGVQEEDAKRNTPARYLSTN